MLWNYVNGGNEPMIGLIPDFLSEWDDRGAVAQINENYTHGGGWREFEGFTLKRKSGTGLELDVGLWRLQYPEDPPYMPIAWAYLREEVVVVWPHGWVTVCAADGSETFNCARLD